MKSDKHFYGIFAANPEWFFELTQRRSPGPCRFISVAIKAIERRADGVLIPVAIGEPIFVTEWQMHLDDSTYGRIVIEMAMVQSENAGRAVAGIIIFASRDLDPKVEPWSKVVSVYYLDELLEQLAAKSPDHPLVAVFQPLIENDKKLLEKNAAKYYTQIKSYPSDERSKDKLLSVFMDWMMQRFDNFGIQEIEKMLLGELPDLRETQAGKDLIAIGIGKGEFIGTILTCQSVLNTSSFSEEQLREKSIDDLSKLASDLQQSLRNRLGGT